METGRISRLGVVAVCAAMMLAVGATSASAVIVHLPSGRTISYQPLRGALPAMSTFSRQNRPLEYHGGPIMPSNTDYAFYWDPPSAPAYPAEYESGLDTYFEDLAHGSGGDQNVDSVAAQYNDGAGEFANYDSHFGGALIDTDPYPANGCTEATICFTGTQLEEEITKYVEAHGLPHGLTHEYFMLTPPGVEDCAAPGECSAGAASGVYCAYHGFIPATGGAIVFANDPYVTGNVGCDDGEHPNDRPSDGELQGGVSHEHNESTTDPEFTAWYGPEGDEIGDKCRTFNEATEFGTPLGTAPDGSRYDQVIDGDLYWYQQEWSNEGNECKQRLGPAPPVVKLISPKSGPAAGGTTVTIEGLNLGGALSIRFGSVAGTKLSDSATSISAIAPAESKGRVNVTVTTPFGTSPATKKDRFKFTK